MTLSFKFYEDLHLEKIEHRAYLFIDILPWWTGGCEETELCPMFPAGCWLTSWIEPSLWAGVLAELVSILLI